MRKRTGEPEARVVRTDYDPSFIRISYSNLSDAWGAPSLANITADPRFLSADDFHLHAGSPCIDSGDPDAPLDPDGSRSDMGAFPFLDTPVAQFRRGQVSGDSSPSCGPDPTPDILGCEASPCR